MYSLEVAKQRAFDRCNLEGDDCDIYRILYNYKSVARLSDKEVDEIYDEIADGLGFTQ